jgi:hypothetical protein
MEDQYQPLFTAPYGTWDNQITVDSITAESNELGAVRVCVGAAL